MKQGNGEKKEEEEHEPNQTKETKRKKTHWFLVSTLHNIESPATLFCPRSHNTLNIHIGFYSISTAFYQKYKNAEKKK